MKIVAVIILFVFGNMNDQETQMTQYIPMANAGECLYEKRMLKKNKDFPKDAFCGPAYVEISQYGEVLKLYNEIPDGATLVNEKISKEAMKAWTLESKKKWEKNK